MGRMAAGLEPHSRPVIRIFFAERMPETLLGLDVEGKINSFSSLDILTRWRYVIDKAAVDKAAATP